MVSMKMHRVLMVFVAAAVVLSTAREARACKINPKVKVAAVQRRHLPDAGDYVALLPTSPSPVASRVPVYIEVPAERVDALAPDALVELFDVRGNVVAAGPV